MKRYDFLIVGAGVVGSWIAFELSKYNNSVCVLEKEIDAGAVTSKANSAIIHAGFDPKPGTKMASLNVRGNEIIRECHEKLSIPFKQIGSIVAAFSSEGLEKLDELFARGRFNGVPGLKILSREETINLENGISGEVRGSLYAPTGGICSPFELTLAPLETASLNGVDVFFSTPILSVKRIEKGFVINDRFECGMVINASGLESGRVASLFGDDSVEIFPRKGEYSLLDSSVGEMIHHTIFQLPTKNGKGILVSPTVDSNILVGPNAEDVSDPYDTTTTTAGQSEIFQGGRICVPGISEKDIITSFSGVRAISNSNDFIIGFSSIDGLFNVAGICSPGLTASPAIAEYTISLLEERGVVGKKKENYIERRDVVRFSELSNKEKIRLLEKNPLYGRVICRCEGVTEGEIVDSIHRPLGATTIDGVKRRVRAGMGRCQGGFCSPRVMEILSRELDIPFTEVTKFGRGSYMTLEKEGKTSD